MDVGIPTSWHCGGKVQEKLWMNCYFFHFYRNSSLMECNLALLAFDFAPNTS